MRITDEQGNDLPMVNQNTFGSARLTQAQGERSCFSGVPHRSAPKTVGSGGTCRFAKSEGDYAEEGLRHPAASAFIVQGMAPGETVDDLVIVVGPDDAKGAKK